MRIFLLAIQFSHMAVSNCLRPHEPQHNRLPYLSATSRACWNFCPLSQWCHPTTSSSVVPFSSGLQSLTGSVFSNELVLHIKWPKYWSPCNEYSGLISFRIDWFDLLAVQGTVKSSPTPQFKNINFSTLSFIYCPTLTAIYDYWKNHSLD